MKRLFLILLLLPGLFFSQSGSAPAEAPLFRDPGTEIVFPGSLGKLKFKEAKNLESKMPGAGVGITYCYKKCDQFWADIFIYQGGRKKIPDGTGHREIHLEWEEAQKGLYTRSEQGLYQDLERLWTSATALGNPRENPTALSAEFSFSIKGVPYLSNLYLLGFKNHFIKIRATFQAKDKKQYQKFLRGFLSDFGDILKMTKNPPENRVRIKALNQDEVALAKSN